MKVNLELPLQRSKRSCYVSFFTLSFVLVFPLFFDFKEEAWATERSERRHSHSRHQPGWEKQKVSVPFASGVLLDRH